MTHLQQPVAELLSGVQRPGDFYATGTVDMHPPRLIVDGVGTVALPLLPVQAEQLIAVAERAPYGRGAETLVDTDVRRTWQIDAARLDIAGKRWTDDLAQIVRRVTLGLGVSGEVDAELYKLLVYDTGSFFISHRDTEKASGMFATLVLVLPSDYSAGELLIRHKGQEVSLDLCREEPSEVAYAAFYADCRYEVLPVQAGCRLALVYNLLRRNGGPLPTAPDHDAEQQALAELLHGWSNAADEAGMPRKLIYPLEHDYTEAELGFSALKGVDAAVAGVVLGAARVADCDLHLALVNITESGWAEYAGSYSRYGSADYEIGEIDETHRQLQHWQRPAGGATGMGALPFSDDEICPPDALADLEDIEPDFEEATGNEGATFERIYQRTALVLWPRGQRSAVLADGGLSVSVPFLTDLVAQWQRTGAVQGNDLWQQARALALRIRDSWPEPAWQRQQASKAGQGAALLTAFSDLGEHAAAAVFIAVQCATGAYGAEDNAAMAKTLIELPSDQATDLLTGLVANNTARRPSACAGLLALCSERFPEPRAVLYAPALALLAALPTTPPDLTDMMAEASSRPSPELVVYSLVGLERIDAALADQAIGHFLAWPAIYPMEDILLRAMLALDALSNRGPAGAEPASIVRLRQAVLDHLDRRIAEPLAPPADWRRPAKVSCRCARCGELNRFLASATEPVWHFKAAERDRRHVEYSVRQGQCDLDLATDQRGRPYTLVCKKNQASYQRRVRQREQDLANREQLGKAGSSNRS